MQTELLDEYILAHISPEPASLKQLNRETNIRHLYGRMCSGHLQGRILKMIAEMIRPKRVLELGTFTGYSTLCLAEGTAHDAEIHSVEIDDEMEDELRNRFESMGYGEKIKLHIGDALKVIDTLPGDFDLVFIDANKRFYCEYFDLVFPKVPSGGFILADNTLWDGKVIDEKAANEPQTKGILMFNKYIAGRTDVETVILPLRDGLTLIRKK